MDSGEHAAYQKPGILRRFFGLLAWTGFRCAAVVADVRVRGARLCCSHRLDGKDHHDRRPRAC